VAAVVYILSAATALLCAVLLLRGYRRSGARLLLWSSLCFMALTIDNLVLWLDEIVFPDVNMIVIRKIPALVGLCLLIYGLIWDSK
jgi:hypothetical protein